MALTAAVAPDVTERWRRLRTPVLTAAGITVASAALRLRDPHQHGAWGLCPFKALTGWDCPGCGGLRAVNDLTHGQVSQAWHSNALFITLVPVLVAFWVVVVTRAWNGSDTRAPAVVARYAPIALAVVAVAFTVFRNTPAGAALHVS